MKQITLKRVLIVFLVAPALIYLYSKVTRDTPTNRVAEPRGLQSRWSTAQRQPYH